MTPAIKLLEQNKVWYQLHAFDQGGSSDGYGDEAIEKLNVDPESIYKTLVTMNNDGSFFVAVLPVVTQLNLKAMAKAVGEKRIFMAPVDKSELVTGYVVGGISALG
ncbi:MAG: YbaK/EbsC family protein, partial [Pseudomonadota bacterium]